jgi:hypothetical protein
LQQHNHADQTIGHEFRGDNSVDRTPAVSDFDLTTNRASQLDFLSTGVEQYLFTRMQLHLTTPKLFFEDSSTDCRMRGACVDETIHNPSVDLALARNFSRVAGTF